MAERAITEDNLGAWLIKCDPETKFDLPGAMADGMDEINSWSVVPGYRADMMAPNDKIILWVSGNGRRMTRGIWGVGRVTGQVEPEDDDDYFSDIGYWLDKQARDAVELFVPVDIPLLNAAVSADEIAASGVTDLEVQRMAIGSNPSWVSKEQLKLLEQVLPGWTDDVPDQETITITGGGAGHGSPAKNAIVEAIAMAAVIEHYGDEWTYDDVSSDKVGWDITFKHTRSGEIVRAEVKGLSGTKPIVFLTANEIRAAENQVGWRLAVVTSALNSPKVWHYTADQALDVAKPYVYKAALPSK
ncbi:DUF3883 domain-containing protein [Nocardioides sp. AX2bis]|uniref:DUF3883 domain-containing protein n=1 Tax=Nocardioides sp. AX2bis TaxID=2653157 RepID=UPI0012F40333|nr:DUF3883 domain-containing protein [Nocardioides sp. AX2bis]VXB45039.1 hypothetical protein NOCARDAX2BIS_220162 [Nocardioides sp. AX2bis]